MSRRQEASNLSTASRSPGTDARPTGCVLMKAPHELPSRRSPEDPPVNSLASLSERCSAPVRLALLATILMLAAPQTSIGQGRGGRGAPSAGGGPDGLAALHFRALGPEGNRVASIIGEPGNSAVVYIGAADGGIWKTTDGGTNWTPIFDGENVSAVGALAMAPSDHNVVWAGTGEPWLIRPYYTLGDGVYKSSDAGRTWQHMGLGQTGHISRIIVDPRDANSVWVCAIGQAFVPQKERGVFHTTDGGATWRQSLAVNDSTGCSDLAMDPTDPRT